MRRSFGVCLALVFIVMSQLSMSSASCDADGICTHSKETIIVVGGGLAGMSAAIEVRANVVGFFWFRLFCRLVPQFPSCRYSMYLIQFLPMRDLAPKILGGAHRNFILWLQSIETFAAFY
jgi:hypothetical protein